MADKEHLELLLQGVKSWNRWRETEPQTRPDLHRAVLKGFNLQGIDLTNADLRHCNLGKAQLRNADLTNADASDADLTGADLTHAVLNGTLLDDAHLGNTVLADATLDGTTFRNTVFGFTVLDNLDLRKVIGLASARHRASSKISQSTLFRSGGDIPEEFLRGCGLSDQEIITAKSFAEVSVGSHPASQTLSNPLSARTLPRGKSRSERLPEVPHFGSGAFLTWQERLDFLLEQEAVVSDPIIKFQLRKEIQEARARVYELQPSDVPQFPDAKTRQMSEELEKLYERLAALNKTGKDTSQVEEAILDHKRRLREGGRLKPGDFLMGDRLRLLSRIGRGGFAEVWEAYDKKERAYVAVKVLHGQFADDLTTCQRLFRGSRYMARLHHQGIVRVIEDRCEDGGFHFFVMELVPGGDLRQAVLNDILPPRDRLKIIIQVGEALTFAHGDGVVHRDVKPGNILLDGSGRAKLTDFDLVLARDSTAGTRTGMLGTVVYAAPEQMASAKAVGPAADIYGLGMTTIFAIHGDDLPQDVIRNASDFIADLGINTALRDVLAKAVAWKTENRWSTMDEFCKMLEYSLRDERGVGLEKDGLIYDSSDHDGNEAELLGRFIELWSKLEISMEEMATSNTTMSGRRPPDLPRYLRDLELMPEDHAAEINTLGRLRNSVVHGQTDTRSALTKAVVDRVEELVEIYSHDADAD